MESTTRDNTFSDLNSGHGWTLVHEHGRWRLCIGRRGSDGILVISILRFLHSLSDVMARGSKYASVYFKRTQLEWAVVSSYQHAFSILLLFLLLLLLGEGGGGERGSFSKGGLLPISDNVILVLRCFSNFEIKWSCVYMNVWSLDGSKNNSLVNINISSKGTN